MKKVNRIGITSTQEVCDKFEEKKERFITQVDEDEYCVHDSLEEAKNYIREIYNDIIDNDDIKIYAVTREYIAEVSIKVELS